LFLLFRREMQASFRPSHHHRHLHCALRDAVFHSNTIASYLWDTTLEVEEGSLYPSLQRLLVKGFLTGEWGKTADNRRARYYLVTPAGRKHLGLEVAEYLRVNRAIHRIIQPA
jgi:hypothetical protein